MSKSPDGNILTKKMDFFKNVQLFHDFTDREIECLVEVMQVEQFEAGTYLMREGTEGDKMYILLEGRVEVSKSLLLPEWLDVHQKQEKSLLHFSDQQFPFFGEMVILGDTSERSASIRTLTSCLLASITREAFESVVREKPMLGMKAYRNIATELASRLRKANRDILKLTTALSIALERQ